MDVQPDKQNIDKLFSNTTYYIDFYQRQYKWTDEPVKRLLDDVFYKFNEEYKKHKDSSIELDQIISKYSWYYLNTYVTNHVEGKIYIVDGQQRLTTLTLILIKLKHLAKDLNSQLEGWISNKIVGLSGYKTDFWMNHELHKNSMKGLFDGDELDKIDTSSGLTAQNMVANFSVVSSRLHNELKDLHRFESFVFYFMHRLVLINLNVEQTDVPMVFEVINDRGVKLKPYEILKGKLLGQITKEELDNLNLNDLWESQVTKINAFKEDEIDQFFIYYLKAKFADTIGEGRRYDKDYHRVIFSENKLKLDHNPKEVKDFLQNNFEYYTNLYSKVLKYYKDDSLNNGYAHVYYNGLTEMDMQFLLILSSCILNDPQEDDKIKKIAFEVDRLFSLLQLQRSYGSNAFAVAIYKLSAAIREKDIHEIRPEFDKTLLELLSDARGVPANSPLSYGFFKETGIELDKRFKRYFFARIEKFIADNTKLQVKHSLYDLVQNTGHVNGFHIEHILADNEENLKLFDEDEEKFKSERNRLGGLLLLKGKDNISSNNETYKNKLKSYANTLYWNETLREDSYKSKLDFTDMINKYSLNFRHLDTFGQAELEERHRLLYDMVKYIWE
ncbi:DUF262 domain-containing protein [Carboxylicivirga sediminis]|uniref:DUF262 domain-containing protein n=1 Tax=Carboxylicivirga sediminis TaxID=2006564 RepID=A0A941F649_9BACT|nr:DUF262 domain-containing protein [Carboxylicivirga sediminis]MBR8536633.1 DUF262 domain-containing protein [Carboxylicivirga sediminis]